MLRYLYKEPAIVCGKTLVISDLHLGIASAMFERGVRIKPQGEELAGRVLKLAEEQGAEKVLILGDAKHTVPSPNVDEMREVMDFFSMLRGGVEVTVVRGNHDGGIERWASGAEIAGSGGILLGKYGFAHGHAWPDEELMGSSGLVVGHMHPAIALVDKVGGRSVQPAWAVCRINEEKAGERYREFNPKLELVVMPPFNPLVGTIALNEMQAGDVPGPLFRNEMFKLDGCRMYLLDGTCIGQVSNLRIKGD